MNEDTFVGTVGIVGVLNRSVYEPVVATVAKSEAVAFVPISAVNTFCKLVTVDESAFVPICAVIVDEKLASSPSAAASSLRVSSVAGAVSTKLEIAVFTKVSVA